MMANKLETALHRAPPLSLLLVSHGGIYSVKCHSVIITAAANVMGKINAAHSERVQSSNSL